MSSVNSAVCFRCTSAQVIDYISDLQESALLMWRMMSHNLQASDIYSIGVLLYEMVTGKKAWAGLNTFQIFYVTVEAAVERLEVPEGVPSALSDIINICMERNPGRRPTASDLLRRIEAALVSLEGSL